MLWLRIDGARRDDACAYTDWDVCVSGITPMVLIGFGSGVAGVVSNEVGGHMMDERTVTTNYEVCLFVTTTVHCGNLRK
jgi:hypothetical protein